MSLPPDPDTLAVLTREYGAYGRERSGLGLLLGECLLSLATMTLPVAFLGGLEGLKQPLQFKVLERRLAGAGLES